MSGHNKWSSTKHHKAIIDKKKGKIFSEISKELIIAAQKGGSSPLINSSLADAVLAEVRTNTLSRLSENID